MNAYGGSGTGVFSADGSGAGNLFGESGGDFMWHFANAIDNGLMVMEGGDGNNAIDGLSGAENILDGGTGDDARGVHDNNTAFGGAGSEEYHLVAGGNVVEIAAIRTTLSTATCPPMSLPAA